MQTKYVKTVITYDIRDDDKYDDLARNALRQLLFEMKYEYADNQSTMVHMRRIPKRTLDSINTLCNDVIFNHGDEISIYTSEIIEKGQPPLMVKRRYVFSPRNNQFQ